MLLLFIFTFSSGVGTILAPSFWPLLPLILSTARGNASSYRPLSITAGILISFIACTVSVSVLTQYLHINPHHYRYAAIIALCFIAACLFWPAINNRMMGYVHRIALFTTHNNKSWDNGTAGDMLTGILLGAVWAPFAAPVLEPLAELVTREHLGWQVLLMNTAYILGISLPLFLVSLGGQRLIKLTTTKTAYTRILQIFFGITTLITVAMLATGFDRTLQHTARHWLGW